jgi:carboxyl-terminal processing protease
MEWKDNMRNVIKLGFALVLVVLLVVAAFAIGYQAGNATEDQDADSLSQEITSSQTEPTGTSPTVVPTLIPSPPFPAATDTPSPAMTAQPAITYPAISPSPAEPMVTLEPEAIENATITDEEALQVLSEVWDLVESEFYGELPPPEERVYGAIRGMLGTLDDDYTSFIEPSIAEINRTDASGSFEGIGALVSMNEDDILEIVRPFEDQPADKAGLLPGDMVLAVDSESIVGYGIYEAITLIRGPEGTTVVLTIQRGTGTEAFDVAIVRARIDIPIVESRMLEETIGYVSLFDFSAQATLQLETAIQELQDQGANGLILDLRGNPGGFLDQAVRVSDVFLDEGLVLIERSSDGRVREFTSTRDGVALDIPLVVLVNGGSASASEIVAGAIQDRGRGVLIGETTFGKGSVQLPHTLSDGSELRVTIARWFTPNDRAIHGEGLAPDIEVTLTPEDLEADRDPQLERAIEYLKTGQ